MYVFILLVLDIAFFLWQGFVISTLWSWFVIPTFHLPPLPAAVAAGLIAILLVVRPVPTDFDKDDMVDSIIQSIMRPFMALAFGYVFTLFM